MTEQDPLLSADPVGEPVSDPISEPVDTPALSEKSPPRMQIFVGPNGPRAGWSILLFLLSTLLFLGLFGTGVTLLFKNVLHIKTGNGTPQNLLIGQIIEVVALLGAATLCARIERRRIRDYNLTGPARLRRFLTGIVGGFLALSALVGAMAGGSWLHFGPVTLSTAQIFLFGGLWALVFILTGFGEEGAFRCYLQFTLTRGINLWWALGLIAAMCVACAVFIHNEGAWGIYAMAGLGLLPILALQRSGSAKASFWQAAWVTSTFFGFIHTGNNGETWIGIFSAAAIGFLFCVSIRLTGSAWWAIGFHAAWDWAETFFYGTFDSGLVPMGHYLTTTPAGSPLYSGGTDGPEGSLLVIPLIVVTLLAILLVYRQNGESTSATGQAQLS